MMRGFISDNQRRAAFANMFARRGKANLEMFTDDLGRLRVSSDTTADTSFLLSTDLEPVETKKLLEQLDEESLAGVKKMGVVRPKVMMEYQAEPGFYTYGDEYIPFGRRDIPKIIATAERRGRKSDTFIPTVAKDIARAAFQNMYHQASVPDEEGNEIISDFPEDLLEEEYLMQIYDDYSPSKDVMDRIESMKQDLSDEVWRIRSLQRLGHPTTLEARAWRMGKKPRVDVETFVDVPKRKYEKSGRYAIGEEEEEEEPKKSPDEELFDLYKKRSESIKPAELTEESWKKDSDLAFKTTADLMLTGKFEVASRLDNEYLDNMIDYTTGHWNPAYGVVRERLIAEKSRREGVEFSKKMCDYMLGGNIDGYNVIGVKPDVLKDYAGINKSAARVMGFKDYPIKENEILVDERLSPEHRDSVIKHEIYEDNHMRGGESYWEAHKGALKHET